MRPKNLKTKIFLDSGDPQDTKKMIEMMGFLDGQTTNPSLVVKNPEAQARLEAGNKFTKEEIDTFYHEIITEISELIPEGTVSVEVYADDKTTTEQIVEQAKKMYAWVPNAHVKLPTTEAGLEAAKILSKDNMRLNLTLCFSQEQAAAVYSATQGSKEGSIYVSPFIGRLDDLGEHGMDLVANILQMYSFGDKHVHVLAASIRNLEHLLHAINIGVDIITVPFKILEEWVKVGMPISSLDYKNLDLSLDWQQFNIKHDLTDKGLQKFAADWNKIIK